MYVSEYPVGSLEYAEVSKVEDSENTGRSYIEKPIVAFLIYRKILDKDYIIGSCKYRNEKIGMDEFDLLRDYASVFGKENNYHYYIFSKGGFTNELLQTQEHSAVRLITLEDLYR